MLSKQVAGHECIYLERNIFRESLFASDNDGASAQLQQLV